MTDEDPIRIEELRAERLGDNTKWLPIHLAEAFVRDIKTGKVKPERVILLYEEALPDGGHRVRAYRSNVTRDQEISVLFLQLLKNGLDYMKPV